MKKKESNLNLLTDKHHQYLLKEKEKKKEANSN